jgi:hypothetical protein
VTAVDVAERAASGTYPVPAGRVRWRTTLHNRQYASNVSYASLAVAEFTEAITRKLDQQWNTPATYSFTLDGHDPAAALVHELAQDVIVWRWDDQVGYDRPMFRGPICQSQDTVTEQSHTVTFTCHDYLALLARRLLTFNGQWTQTNVDQDDIVWQFLAMCKNPTASGGTSFPNSGFLPVTAQNVNPDGSTRAAKSGQIRVRNYVAQQTFDTMLADLAAVINGFDFDILPITASNSDSLRIFYPNQGVTRTTPALVYGSTISGLVRSVNSADYGNYIRVLGNNQQSDPTIVQLYAETWNNDATNGNLGAVGLWMTGDNAASVTDQATLTQQAAGDLVLDGLLTPTYAVTMRPGAYSWGNPNMGDTVPLVVQSGRLNVSTYARVVGISYAIGDDSQEDVTLTLGKPLIPLAQLLADTARDVDALARR